MKPSLAAVVLAASALLPAVSVTPAQAVETSCVVGAAERGVEERRLADPRSAELVTRGGLGSFTARFPAALCSTRSVLEAEELTDAWGTALWQAAVNRTQGRRPGGDLAPADDRPLYWTRLAVVDQLAGWQPQFPVDRDALRARFEDASRGLKGNDFGAAPGVKRIFVSGFDPFGLDGDLRTANPSGSAALSLNGRRVVLDDGSAAEIRAVVLPVRYADFDHGIVERAFAPRLTAGPRAADRITTISQGYPGLFTVEAWAGRARSADPYPDNTGALSGGTYQHPVVAPGMGPGAEFIPTTLPGAAWEAAAQSPYPVLVNTEVTEIPAGESAPVDRADGPTPGSRAVAGGGGGYLSNEVAYRSNRLRLELRPELPGGHLHTPVLTGLPSDRGQLSGPVFEQNEVAITAEILTLLRAGWQ
ncbi:pyrrolidone-carboxylate peptidase [Kitasatospora gansuensis]|uniref:Pyrrolidone-carboxylate peptidase n=1 Tax=Kitasatospora gansuensis TaxID=258050 RepID=A0A7W7S803_9ACTN|nr:pyroglutamyl peptidase [Kitasatospora gansuensis]MBB4944591.1 pyrrolidone-carboxylate peptidase [Kitasatospora gansuensis]